MTHETVLTLRRMLADAPADPGPIAPDLRGWWTVSGFYVCARCAGRIMARGCQLPAGCKPVWVDQPTGVCVTCTPAEPPEVFMIGGLQALPEDKLAALLYDRWLATNLDRDDDAKHVAYVEVLDEIMARGIDAGGALFKMARKPGGFYG